MKILADINSMRELGITCTIGEELSLSVYTNANCASNRYIQSFDFGCCDDVGERSGVRDESHAVLRDVVYDRDRVRSACRGGQGGDGC